MDKEGEWNLPPLFGLLSAPTLRQDGSILDKPGYDEATGLLFEPCGEVFPPIPRSPTQDDARTALGKLKSLIGTFPFKGEASRAVALSCLLTAVIRRSLDTAPLHAFTAPAAGSGKSKLADIASVLATGREAGIVTPHPDPNEFEKRLGAMLLASEPVIAIDNCAHPLGGEALCSAITQKRVRVRILGLSRMPEVASNCLLTANGNNLVLSGDMTTRRAVLCSLDAECERPELREFANDPGADAKRQRPELVVAALTVLRAFHIADRPTKPKAFGGMAPWSEWVRAALLWLGEADPVDTVENIRAVDQDAEIIVSVLTEWRRKFVAEEKLARDVAAAAEETRTQLGSNRQEPANAGLRNAILAIPNVARGGAISSRALGTWLQRIKGSIVSLDSATQVRLVIAGNTDGVARWKVEVMVNNTQP